MAIHLIIAISSFCGAIILHPLNSAISYQKQPEIKIASSGTLHPVDSAFRSSTFSDILIPYKQESFDLCDEIFIEFKCSYFNIQLFTICELADYRKNNNLSGSALLYCELDLPPPIFLI